MDQNIFLEKLEQAPAASFHVLDPAKAKRMNARTLYIPSPQDVARAIAAIPAGETRTIRDLRAELAGLGNAETACPAATIKYWKWMASASVEPGIKESVFNVPWWRVLKDGKPSRHMPGGVEGQIARLKEEGVEIE
jgi:alkylated DNA nucleotide flippase Atl1